MDRTYTPEERALFASDSNAFWADREAIYTACEARFDAMRPDSPKWQEGMAMSRLHLEARVSDPILREKLWPDYPLGCKRVLLSDDFYPAMTLPHVELETERITSIEPLGIRTAEGRLHQLDVVIYATGFETLSFGAQRKCVPPITTRSRGKFNEVVIYSSNHWSIDGYRI